MEPSILERINGYYRKINELQEICTHKFTLRLPVNQTRFYADKNFDAICSSCTLRITFSSWDLCPKCFNDLSNIEPSHVSAVFQGNGPVGDGQAYGRPTLEKRCTCGVTVWKD